MRLPLPDSPETSPQTSARKKLTPQTLDIAVTPFRADDSATSLFNDHVCAAIFISNPDHSKPSLAKALRQLYGLTQAEAEVLKNIADGMPLSAITETRRVSMNTARTQLKSIMQKTGTKRQAELVRLVYSGPAGLLSK